MTAKTNIGVQRKNQEQANKARRLIGQTRATDFYRDATVEILGCEDVKYRDCKYGELAFVRSKFSFIRFFILNRKHGECNWHCSCGKNTAAEACPHRLKLARYLNAEVYIFE